MINIQILLSESQTEVNALKFIEYLRTLIYAYVCLVRISIRTGRVCVFVYKYACVNVWVMKTHPGRKNTFFFFFFLVHQWV